MQVAIFITRFPVDCYVITGGGIISATDRVHVTGARKKSGSFNLAYVSELKGTIYTYLLSYIVPSFERESTSDYKYDESESSEDIEFRNNLLLNQANNNAKYVAYTNANKEIKVKSQSLYVYYISKDAVTDLKVGDKVLEVDGKGFQTFSSLREYINTKSSGEVLSVKVEENGKKKTKSAKLYKDAKENVIYMGVSIMLDKNYEVSPKVDIKFRNSEGGPSGGLMMSLEIYSQLINKDITRGRKIVGTGTISEDGEVGEIDGVKWYNDSIGTSPTRTIAGLNSFDEKIVLIAGGYDKHLDYTPIAKPIVENVSKLILMGATAEKIEKVVRDELEAQGKEMPIYHCSSLNEVVNKAKEIATPDEIVLFSPASASFDLFKNFEERGNLFKELVNNL